jgi:hypothetical protein
MYTHFKLASKARKDYKIDWSEWLHETETITKTSIVAQPGITVETPIVGNKDVVLWVTPGIKERIYNVSCVITTSENSRRDEQVLVFEII